MGAYRHVDARREACELADRIGAAGFATSVSCWNEIDVSGGPGAGGATVSARDWRDARFFVLGARFAVHVDGADLVAELSARIGGK